jgi:hypothetical protein
MKLHCWNGLTPKKLNGGADSDEQQRGEVGSWVGEMAGEVGARFGHR